MFLLGTFPFSSFGTPLVCSSCVFVCLGFAVWFVLCSRPVGGLCLVPPVLILFSQVVLGSFSLVFLSFAGVGFVFMDLH